MHRMVLTAVALLAVNYALNLRLDVKGLGGIRSWKIESSAVLVGELNQRLHRVAEIDLVERLAGVPLNQVFAENRYPFFWVVRGWMELFPMGAIASTLVISNAFFLLFLFEIYILLSRMVLLDTALWGVLLILVFPSSYEMSLGSSLSFSLCMTAIMLRRALDNQWFLAGGAIGLLALGDWIVLGWLPLLAGIFWYYQRHFQLAQVVKRAVFLGVPLAVGIGMRWEWYRHAIPSIGGSALASLLYSPGQWVAGLSMGWQMSGAGPVISLIVFLIGAVLSLASHTTWLNRLIPIYAMGVVLAFSSVANTSTRLLFAGIALAGIAHVSSGTLAKLFAAFFTSLTAGEVFRVFSVT